ncbi:hypothetical protein N431DRAFT_415963 [Stipitochalara longipes BDJ]|nr:hypothetical protein N431DRAFT_415963 [Stipitochalara longipes BDJ]
MDPLTALGLASNIVQFVDFTGKLLSSTRKLYVSSSGAKGEHLEIESLARDIRELAKQAGPNKIPREAHMRKGSEAVELFDLSGQCVEVSDDLLSVLESLKVKGDHRGWDSFYQALRCEWKQSEIEGLQQRLSRISNQLNARVLLDRQAKIESKLHQLSVENRRLEASRTENISELREDFVKLFKQIQRDLREEGVHKEGALRQLSLAAEKGAEYSSEQIFLEFLRFDVMEDRQITVQEAHHDTFSWIFRDSIVADEIESSANFGEWLQSDDTLFWVSGKPGSGKSTLMKFICEHEDTGRSLEKWATGQRLVIASFFFWNAGRNPLQKSQEGLLRSILYQILRQAPDLMTYAFPSLWSSRMDLMNNLRSLTTRKFLGMFQDISAHLSGSNFKFCFFIDGLDEYEGKPNDIIRLVELLKSTSQVKICVSSRPWNEFEKAFGQDKSKKLYMQDLTRGDIEIYVRDTLEQDTGFRKLQQRDANYLDLVQEVIDTAQGVFLWVFLVVRSLLEGLTNADRIIDLQRRLRLLPTDLNEYFERLLFTVDNFYRKQTAQMLQVTLAAYEPLPLTCYWFIDQEDDTLLERMEVATLSTEVIDERLKQMRKRLNACCKGLLEAPRYASNSRAEYFITVDFLHRTVRDFLRIPDIQNMINKWVGIGFDANVAICEATLAQVKTTPREGYCFDPAHGRVSSLLKMFFYHIEALEDEKYPVATEVRLLDQLETTLRVHGSVVTDARLVLPSSRRMGLNVHATVLEEAAQRGLQRYVSTKLNEPPGLISEMQSNLLLAALLPSHLSSRKNLDHWWLPIVSMLLRAGLDPNSQIFYGTSPFSGASVWTAFLADQDVGTKEQKNIFPIIKELLEHGADSKAVCKPSNEKAADIVKRIVSKEDVIELEPFLNPEASKFTKGSRHEGRRKRDVIKAVFRRKQGS